MYVWANFSELCQLYLMIKHLLLKGDKHVFLFSFLLKPDFMSLGLYV